MKNSQGSSSSSNINNETTTRINIKPTATTDLTPPTEDHSVLSEFTAMPDFFFLLFFCQHSSLNQRKRISFSFFLLLSSFTLPLRFLCLALVLGQEKESSLLHSYFRWTYFSLSHTFFLDLLLLLRSIFFCVSLPPELIPMEGEHKARDTLATPLLAAAPLATVTTQRYSHRLLFLQ